MPFAESGVLIIDKPEGISSNHVLSQLKRILDYPKMGHGGTLDPFATGVLPVFLNKATRLAGSFLSGNKMYQGTVRFGFFTDTYDRTGTPSSPEQPISFGEAEIHAWLEGFRGTIRQTVPAFSAAKWKGRPLYSYAREGKDVPLKERDVVIHSLEVISWASPCLVLDVSCSGGTYIRSLAHELGKRAGCGAHLQDLRRTATGPFSEKEAVTLDELEKEPSLAHTRLVSMETLVESLPPVHLSQEALLRVCNGNRLEGLVLSGCLAISPSWPSPPPPKVRLMSPEGKVVAIGDVSTDTSQEGPVSIHPGLVLA